MENENLLENIKTEYGKRFKDSIITFKNGCFGNDTIFVDCYLARNENEVVNGYLDNDCFKISFVIKIIDDNDYILENMAKSFRIKPINKYLFCSHCPISFRKVRGDETKIEKTLNKFFDKLKEAVKENYNNDNLLDRDRMLVKEIIEGI